MPVKKAAMPETPINNTGIDNVKLSKNVAPPLCPEATSNWNNPNSNQKTIINPTDHFPKRLFGITS